MGKLRCEKLHQNRGIARLVVILTVAALVLLAAALYPVIQRYRFRADALGCLAGLDTARRQLAAAYLFEGENSSAEIKLRLQSTSTIQTALMHTKNGDLKRLMLL